MIAWTEGWANGFSGIVDRYYEAYDGEYKYYSTHPYHWHSTDADYAFSEGVRSEYNIALTLIDFWDGGVNSADNDVIDDKLSIPFKTLIKPIYPKSNVSGNSNKYIESFGDYYKDLLKELPTCDEKSEAGHILILNEVMKNGGSFNHRNIKEAYGDGVLASGVIKQTRDVENPKHEHWLMGYNTFEVPMEFNFVGAYTEVLNVKSNYNEDLVLTDPIFTNNLKELNLYSKQLYQVANGKTCGRADIKVDPVAPLNIGKENYPFNLSIDKGTMLNVFSNAVATVKKGSTLVVRKEGNLKVDANATLVIEKGGKLIIEEGAYVCIDPNAIIDIKDYNDVTIHTHKSGWSTKTHYTGMGIGFYCNTFDQAFAYNYGLNLELKNNRIDCNTGDFHFQISGWQTLPNDAKICWSFPEQWTVYVNPNCERWAWEVNGSVNNNGNSQPTSGVVAATITSSLGVQTLTYNYTAPAPVELVSNYTDDKLYLCGNEEPAVTITASGGDVLSTNSYTFNWVDQWQFNHALINTSNTSTIKFTGTQWSTNDKTISVTATDNLGCKSLPYEFTVKPNTNGWTNAPMYSSFNEEAMISDVNQSRIVSEEKGNIYYVGEDLRLYTYHYNLIDGRWDNYPIPKDNPIEDLVGPIAIYEEPLSGERTIYYTTLNKQVGKLYNPSYSLGQDVWEDQGVVLSTNLQLHKCGIETFEDNGEPSFIILDTENNNILNDLGMPISDIGGSNITINGRARTVVGDLLYYRNASGNLSSVNLTTKVVNTTSNSVDVHSNIKSDNAGNVWYTAWNAMKSYNPAGQLPSIWASNNTGHFGINKESGVVYYWDNGKMTQLYFDPTTNSLRKNTLISGIPNSDDIHFSNPNVFYLSPTGRMYDIFYYLGIYCAPSVQKKESKLDEIQLNPEEMINVGYPTYHDQVTETFDLFPNPAENKLVIKVKAVDYKLSIIDVTGKLVLNQSKVSEMSHVLDVSRLSNGIYTVMVTLESGKVLNNEKLVINK